MFIGHFALALAAKQATPRVKLGTTVMAAQWLDLLWPVFLLLGWEKVAAAPGITRFTPFDFISYPWTHSLVCVLGWAVLFGGMYYAVRRYGAGALMLAALVVSHWVLDWLTHRPDLPLCPGGPKVGLGLWNSIAGTLILEIALFVAGAAIYLRATRAKDRTGSLALWSYLIFLLAMYLLSAFGSSVPEPKQVAWGGLLMWMFVPWAYWIDRHRAVHEELPDKAVVAKRA